MKKRGLAHPNVFFDHENGFLFQNVAALLVMAIKWIVPHVSRDLRDRMRREAYVTNEIIIRTELLKAQGKLLLVQNKSEDGATSIEDETEPLLWSEENDSIPLRKRSKDTNTGDVTDGRIVM